MQSGRLIFLDFLGNLVVNSYLLAVFYLFYALAVRIFAGDLSGYGDGIEVIMLSVVRIFPL